MKRWMWLGVLVGVLMLPYGAAQALVAPVGSAPMQSGDVAVPPLVNHVMDLSDTLKPDQVRALDSKLADFERSRGSPILVLMVPTTGQDAIEHYARRVFDAWGVGRRLDDGVLLLVATKDRTLSIDVGHGLEGVVTDRLTGRIIRDQIAPHFSFGDFYAGIDAGTDALMAAIRGEALPAPVTADDRPVFLLAPLAFLSLVLPPVLSALVLGAFVQVLFQSLWMTAVAALFGVALAYLGRSMGFGKRFQRRRRPG
ncbi:MAG: TPM domain-containing protein [Alcaligenaceae bacterium]|nr:TPM domain-containing protein [Alcaligenaceae bacterium]